MVSMRHGKVKIGNQITQFLPPSFTEAAQHTGDFDRLYGLVWDFQGAFDAKSVLRLSQRLCVRSGESLSGQAKRIALVDLLRGEEAARELERIYEDTELFGFKVETDSTSNARPTSI